MIYLFIYYYYYFFFYFFWILDFAGCETKQEKKFDVCNGRFYLANITSVSVEDFDGVFD